MPLKRDKGRLNATIGKNIRIERVARNISMAELSERLGVSTSHLGLMERGERGIVSANLWALSKIFDVPIDHFFIPSNIGKEAYDEEYNPPANANRKKIQSLLACAEDSSLEFIANTITGVIKLTQAPKK